MNRTERMTRSAAAWTKQQERLEMALRWGRACGMSVADINKVVAPLVDRTALSACWRRLGQRSSTALRPKPPPPPPGRLRVEKHALKMAPMEWAVVWGYLCGMKSVEIGQLIGRNQTAVCRTMKRLIADHGVDYPPLRRGRPHKLLMEVR